MKKLLPILFVSLLAALFFACIPPDRVDIDQSEDPSPTPTPSQTPTLF